MKNPNDSLVNRICDLPAWSTVPQPTAPPCIPKNTEVLQISKGRPSMLLSNWKTNHDKLVKQ